MHESFPDKLAFTDLETTGMWPPEGEIIEIGLVVAETKTLEIIDRLNVKVQPQHIATAHPEALRVNGYSPEQWHDAVSLDTALRQYIEKARGAALCAWRVAFDFTFLQAAMHDADLLPTGHQTTQLCVYSMARQALRDKNIQPFRLKTVAQFLGLPPEPEPHRAINGAEQAFEIYKKLRAL